jgi:hypothetical protein
MGFGDWGEAAGSTAQIADALLRASHHGARGTVQAFTRTEVRFGQGRWRSTSPKEQR